METVELKFDRTLVMVLSAYLRVEKPTLKMLAEELNCSESTIRRVTAQYSEWFWYKTGSPPLICLTAQAQEALDGAKVVL